MYQNNFDGLGWGLPNTHTRPWVQLPTLQKQTTIRTVTREEDKKVVQLPSVLIRLYCTENWRLRGISTEASDSRQVLKELWGQGDWADR